MFSRSVLFLLLVFLAFGWCFQRNRFRRLATITTKTTVLKATLYEVLEADPSLSTFSQLLRESNEIRDFLNCHDHQECPVFTVFAPTNAAFDKMPPHAVENLRSPQNREVLNKLLAHHIGLDVMRLRKVYPLEKQELHKTAIDTLAKIPVEVQSDRAHVMVDGVEVVLTNMECENGIIHAVDQVLCGSVGMDYYDAGGFNN